MADVIPLGVSANRTNQPSMGNRDPSMRVSGVPVVEAQAENRRLWDLGNVRSDVRADAPASYVPVVEPPREPQNPYTPEQIQSMIIALGFNQAMQMIAMASRNSQPVQAPSVANQYMGTQRVCRPSELEENNFYCAMTCPQCKYVLSLRLGEVSKNEYDAADDA